MTFSCISLWNPWAVLFAHGLKRVETRHWALRGPFPRVLAVHAAKTWSGELSALCVREPFKDALESLGHFHPNPFIKPAGMPFGAVVGLVRVAECRETSDRDLLFHDAAWVAKLSAPELAFGDYSPGRFGWVCDRSFALPQPVPCRGHQSLFTWEPPADLKLPEWAKESS